MSTATNWTIGVGLAVIAVAIGGAATWRHQHPGGTMTADLASVLPPIPHLASKPNPTVQASLNSKTSAVADIKPAEIKPAEIKPAGETEATEQPRLDTVRVERSGDAIIAGVGAPNAKIALMAAGKVLAETKANENGEFVLIPSPLSPGNHDLTLRETDPSDAARVSPLKESPQSIALSIPVAKQGQVGITLVEPGKPDRILSPGTPVASAAPARPQKIEDAPKPLGIQSVSRENGTGVLALGTAPPGTSVHVSLNGTHIADVVASRNSEWRVTIRKGLAGGRYTLRADADPPGNTIARTETPFDVPDAMGDPSPATRVSPADSRTVQTQPLDQTATADIPTPPTSIVPEPQPASFTGEQRKEHGQTADKTGSAKTVSADPAQAVIDEIATRQVLNGDNLWNISREKLGDATRFPQILAANSDKIRDPNLIYPGQVFVLPRK